MKKTRKSEPTPRPQVAALPVRVGPDGCEVMLVTSRETRRWIVPKGWPMKGRKDHAAAAQEAFEEAGIRGRVRKHPIGAYTYRKVLDRGIVPRAELCRVMVYRLDVEEECADWREAAQRERRWFSASEAAERVAEPRLASMIERVCEAA